VDVNYNGKGAGLSLGTENSFTIHTQTKSHDFYVNLLGRVGHKIATKDSYGNYAYVKTELNGPEILLMALALLYGGSYVPVPVAA
jgi:hypothetical protein